MTAATGHRRLARRSWTRSWKSVCIGRSSGSRDGGRGSCRVRGCGRRGVARRRGAGALRRGAGGGALGLRREVDGGLDLGLEAGEELRVARELERSRRTSGGPARRSRRWPAARSASGDGRSRPGRRSRRGTRTRAARCPGRRAPDPVSPVEPPALPPPTGSPPCLLAVEVWASTPAGRPPGCWRSTRWRCWWRCWRPRRPGRARWKPAGRRRPRGAENRCRCGCPAGRSRRGPPPCRASPAAIAREVQMPVPFAAVSSCTSRLGMSTVDGHRLAQAHHLGVVRREIGAGRPELGTGLLGGVDARCSCLVNASPASAASSRLGASTRNQ